MKKLFFFTCLSVLALSFNSCSKDDGPSSNNNNDDLNIGTVSFKVNGNQRTYDAIIIDEQISGAESVVIYKITAFVKGIYSQRIYFEVSKEYTGNDGINYLEYINTDNSYVSGNSLRSAITENNQNKLKGTFSGQISAWNDDTNVIMTAQINEGSFDINL